jgi:tight adherence protein B
VNLAIAVYLGVSIGLLGLFHLVSRYADLDRARIRKRIEAERRPTAPEEGPRALYRNLDVLSLTSAEEYALVRGMRSGKSLNSGQQLEQQLKQWLQDADISLSAKHFTLLVALLGLAAGAVATWFLGVVPGVVAALGSASLPGVFVALRLRQRRERFLQQLPRAFALMARVIRAGQSVPQALVVVADAFEDPLSGEFRRCQQQQTLGLPPEMIFQEMARRAGILELRIFVVAVTIQRQAGGNLSEVLDRLAGLVRERLQLRQQVRTLTAEGRLQGMTLVVLPFVMYAAMYFLNRPYAETLLQYPTLLWTTAGLMLIGLLWIRKIVNFEI